MPRIKPSQAREISNGFMSVEKFSMSTLGYCADLGVKTDKLVKTPVSVEILPPNRIARPRQPLSPFLETLSSCRDTGSEIIFPQSGTRALAPQLLKHKGIPLPIKAARVN